MNKWLADFKFKITIGWELFAVSMLAGLGIALITVSYHAIKAALVNLLLCLEIILLFAKWTFTFSGHLPIVMLFVVGGIHFNGFPGCRLAPA